jgi:hypothetical protein
MEQSLYGVSVPTPREYDFSDEKLQDSVGLHAPDNLMLPVPRIMGEATAIVPAD